MFPLSTESGFIAKQKHVGTKKCMQQVADHIKFRRLLNAEAHDVQKSSLMAWMTMAEM